MAVFGAAATAALVLAPLVGSTHISLARAFDRSIPFTQNPDAQIFFVARLPRVVAGAVVGATLAAAGVVFQALLRNPLATPFTLGVSTGGALGAVLAIKLGAPGWAGLSAVPAAAFLGALVSVAVVYGLARSRRGGLPTDVLLLAGVTLNLFFAAIIIFVQYLSDFSESYRMVRWLMGDLALTSYRPLLAAALPLAIGSAGLAFLPRRLDLISAGSLAAASRGVDVVATQRLAFLASSLVTGAAVSLSGPIGFVGIIVPHLVRLLVGSDHRIVLPASALFGAAFLIACDLAGRTLMAPIEIPVGVITAMLGGPFFLALLVAKSRR